MRDDRRPPPPTVAQRTEHATGVFCWCNRCSHNGVLPLEALIARLGAELPFPAVHGWPRCQACGSKDIHPRPEWPSLGQVTRHHNWKVYDEAALALREERLGHLESLVADDTLEEADI